MDSTTIKAGPSFWNYDGEHMTRTSDPGWQANSNGYINYAFSADTYDYLCVNLNSGTPPNNVTLEFLTS